MSVTHVPVAGIAVEPASLSGQWRGTSESAANEPTQWTDTHVLSHEVVDSPQEAIIVGQGTSLWRRVTIPFQLYGTATATGAVVLRKQHMGRYTNTVECSGFVVRKRNPEGGAGADEGSPVLLATFDRGFLELSHVGGAQPRARRRVALHGRFSGRAYTGPVRR